MGRFDVGDRISAIFLFLVSITVLHLQSKEILTNFKVGTGHPLSSYDAFAGKKEE